MTGGSGRVSVGIRLRWLERRTGDLLRPGCPHCREGYGSRLFLVGHGEPEPEFNATCRVCGRAYQPSEGVRVFIREMAPEVLERMQSDRSAALSAARTPSTPIPERTSPWAPT